MENPTFENLRRFFERIRNAGLFERIFSWKIIVSLGYEAFGEYQRLQTLILEKDVEIAGHITKNRELARDAEYQRERVSQVQQEFSQQQLRTQSLNERITEKERERATLAEAQANSEDHILRLKGEMVTLAAKNEELQVRINERENIAGGLIAADKKNQQAIIQVREELSAALAKYDQLNFRFIEAQKTIAELLQKEEERSRQHDARVTELMSLKQQLEADRLRVQAERDEEIRSEFAEMEQTWKRHEETVEQSLKSICQRHTIDYCDKEKFPYSGKKPDNALIISDQYVIFDAKSPKNSDELGNFPLYIKNQAEAAKKYAREENVKKDIFLVVPANTVGYLDEFHLDMAEYQVYIVTRESLEPVILALRKIEDYQFVDQLSPEDRENICHVIGRFAHAAKRRIQIDNYFSNEFIRLLQGCSSLPEEILRKVVDYEKAEKMNPPMEKRRKLIPIQELEHDVKVISKEAEAREIDITAVTKERIETIPLDKYLE